MGATSQNTIPVNLANKIDFVKSLTRVVCSSFGPFCLQTMLTTSTGAVLSTSEGEVILRSLQVSHPLARLLVDAVLNQHSATGNGTKTLLLLLDHALRAVAETTDIHASSQHLATDQPNTVCNRIATTLGHFSNTVLSGVFTELQQRADILDVDCPKGVLKDRMFAVMLTTISTHFSPSVSQYFASLLIESLNLESDLQDLECVRNKVVFMLDNFEFLHVKSLGRSYKESSTINGILLQKDFSFLSDRLPEMGVKCVLLGCPIEGALAGDNTTMRLQSERTLHNTAALHQKHATHFLQTLHSHHITLIISTEHVPPYVLSLCRTFDISVISSMDKDDVEFLARSSGQSVICNTWDGVDDHTVVLLSECRRWSVGCQPCVHLRLDRELPWSLVLCAPTDGACHQLARVVYKAFKSLSMCFQKTSATQCGDVVDAHNRDVKPSCNSATPDSHNEGVTTCCNTSTTDLQDEGVTCSSNSLTSDCYSKGVTTSCNSITPDLHNKDVTTSSNTSTPDPQSECVKSSCNSLTPNHHNKDVTPSSNTLTPDPNSKHGTLSSSNTSMSVIKANIALDGNTIMKHGVSVDYENSCTEIYETLLNNTACTPNRVQCSQDRLKFVTFPGGGYFEYVLAELLEQKMKYCNSDEISWCCKILAKALTSVPFALHSNLFHKANARSFLVADAEIRRVVASGGVAGFNGRGGVCDPGRECVVEPLATKMAVVYSVIQLLQQLLKIDGIIGVNSRQDSPL